VTFWSRILAGVIGDDRVFKALADPTRRFLLDWLFERDGMQAAGMPEVAVDGEVVAVDPPRRLVRTWWAGWNEKASPGSPRRSTSGRTESAR
jgi:uncharacterized protein YndB with AHSA1/START domain